VASGYTGTVTFSSSDPLAGLPANYTFTAADAGVHAFTATLKKAGTQSLTAADVLASGVRGVEGGTVVSPAAASHLAIVAPATVTQGVGFSLTVSAVDDFGNVNPGYRDKVHLSSTDPKAGTQDFTCSNNDNGVHVFSSTFPTLGSQTLTIVDTTNGSIPGSVVENVVPKRGMPACPDGSAVGARGRELFGAYPRRRRLLTPTGLRANIPERMPPEPT
jgi:hypothetical protein